MSRCSGESLPPTLSRRSSAPSRTAVSGVLSSCETCRRKRFCCGLEIGEPRAQPLEALPEIAQVLRPVHLDPVREIGGAHLADRLVELADRSRDEDREEDGERERDGGRRIGQVAPLLPSLRRDVLQLLDRALGQVVGRAEKRLRAVGELRVTVGELGLRLRRLLRRAKQRVEPRLVVAELVERRELVLGQRQERELPCRRPEFLPDTAVVVEQRSVLEDQVLADDALERARLLEQLAARPTRLRSLLHGLLTLLLEPVEREDQLDERIDERKADEQEAQQDELEERARVIHGGRYNLRQL